MKLSVDLSFGAVCCRGVVVKFAGVVKVKWWVDCVEIIWRWGRFWVWPWVV